MEKRKNENRKALLDSLYSESESPRIEEGLDELLNRHRSAARSRREGAAELSSRDVILITYPDQLREDGVPPLRTLSDFCEQRLGGWISCLHILPFFPSSSDDGFSVVDYRRVDPELGAWEDLDRLRSTFRLMVDAVLNHVSVRSDWFQGFLRGEEPYSGYFIEVAGNPDLSQVVRPRSSPLLHRFAATAGEKSVWTTFSRDQVDLNYRNPRVLLEMADLLLYYVERGVSILRLDAVAYLWKEFGTACINLPQTHGIVRLFRSLLDEAAPDTKLVTETNIPHEQNIAYFGDGNDEAHLVYNFTLPPLLLHTFHTGDCGPLARWAEGLHPPAGRTAFLNFLASHDGIGLNPVRGILVEDDIQRMVQATLDRGGRISFKRNADGGTQPYEMNINYFDALSAPSGGESLDLSVRRFLAAHAVLLSLSGVPAIYFHSLLGSRGWPEGVEQTGSNRAVNRQKLDRAELERELSDPAGLRSRVFAEMSRLIRIRTANAAFGPFSAQRILNAGEAVFCLERIPPVGGGVLCLHNITGRDQVVRLDPADTAALGRGAREVTDAVSGLRHDLRRMSSFHLSPYQTCWLSAAEPPSHTAAERNLPA
jgi:glycosidase